MDTSNSLVAIVRGWDLNKWEMQNFEPLKGNWNVQACGADNGLYPTSSIDLPIKVFETSGKIYRSLGRLARLGKKLGVLNAPSATLVGLEEWLQNFRIAHAAETAISYSEQAVRARERYGTKVVLTCWETIPYAYEDDPEVQQRRAVVRTGADLFLATTQRAAKALVLEGVAPERIRVVMPGVDLARFKPEPRDAQWLSRFQLEADDLIVLFVARFIKEKGLRELLVAYSLMLRTLPTNVKSRCRLLLAGRGQQREFVQYLVSHLGIEEHVRIVGGVDYMEIHKLHQLADVFVLPSIHTPFWEEQYGMVLAEAMACGTPVVSTACGGIPEVVGEAGFIVPQMDVELLAQALGQLLADEANRAKLRQKATERAREHFDANKVAKQISEAYAGLV